MKLGKNQQETLDYIARCGPVFMARRQREVVADAAGCSVEAVGRALAALARKGLIQSLAGTWIAQDPEPSS